MIYKACDNFPQKKEFKGKRIRDALSLCVPLELKSSVFLIIFFLALILLAFDKPFPAANSHIAAHSLKQLEAAWQLTARR